MTKIERFDLPELLERIRELRLEHIETFPLDELNWILSDFLGNWGQRLLLDRSKWPPISQRRTLRHLSDFYLPFSTASDFPDVTSNQIRILAIAAACLDLYVMLLDDIVDEPATSPVAAKLAVQSLLLHFYRMLNRLFSYEHPLWNEVERLLNLTSQTMLEEYKVHGHEVRPFSLAEFKRIILDKMAFNQINCVALAMLNNTPARIPHLLECWDAINLGIMVIDDVGDWRADYANTNYTYLLSQILLSPPFKKDVEAGKLPEPDMISANFFCSDYIEGLYDLAYTQLKTAAILASEIECPALLGMIRRFQKKIKVRAEELFNNKLATLIGMAKSS